jgi:serine/threonine protein kinase/tetratricopeptide (TPR) repeat protein
LRKDAAILAAVPRHHELLAGKTAAEEAAPALDGGAGLAEPAPELARIVGDRYLLLRELGRGGFGVVWQAIDRTTQTACCVKFLQRRHASTFALIRFKREFRTARRLKHPGCIRVHELHCRHGVWFYTMEHVAGTSMRRDPHLPRVPEQVVAVGLQVLAALDHIHGQGIIHRDIKPHNILLARAQDGGRDVLVAKLSDFGVARVGDLDDDERLLSLRGSLPYLAPELVAEGVADARGDLYALGVTLYQALTSRHPLGEPRSQTRAAWAQLIKEATPIDLREIAPEVPEAVATVVRRLLAKDPAARYRTAAQAHAELAAWYAGQRNAPTIPDCGQLSGSPYLAAPRLVGRDSERRQIEGFVAGNLRPASDPGRAEPAAPLLLLSGPAGVGKSRLLSWTVRTLAEQVPHVLTGYCRNDGRGSFQGMSSIINALRARVPGEQRQLGRAVSRSWRGASDSEAVLTGSHESAPAQTESEVSANPEDVGSTSSTSIYGLRQLLEELTELLVAAVDEAPTVIVVEDLQWADLETLELLKAWARAVALHRKAGGQLPVAIFATVRPWATNRDIDDFRRTLARDHLAVVLEVDALGSEAAVALVGELLMHPVDDELRSLCRGVFGHAEVTPLFVTQGLRLLLSKGCLTDSTTPWSGAWKLDDLAERARDVLPGTVEEAIGERAFRLSVETKNILAIAAVIGARFSLPVVARASGVDETMARECLEEAERAGFVAPAADLKEDETFVFCHDGYREAIYSGQSEDARRHLHSSVARALQALTTRRHSVASELAYHYHAAGVHADAYQFARVAGNRAFANCRYAAAADLFSLAVASAAEGGIDVPIDVYERLGDAASLAVRVDEAEAAYGKVLAKTRQRVRRARIHARLGDLYLRAHDSQRALGHYLRGVYAAAPGGEIFGKIMSWAGVWVATVIAWLPNGWTVILAWLSNLGISAARRRAVHDCAMPAAALAVVNGAPFTAVRMGMTGVVMGLALRRTRGPEYAVGCAFSASYFSSLGRDQRARDWLARAPARDLDHWPPRNRCFYHLAVGATHLMLANCELSLEHFERAFSVALELRDPLLVGACGRVVGEVHYLFGRSEAGLVHIDRLRRFAETEDFETVEVAALKAQALLLWDVGQSERALDTCALVAERQQVFDSKDEHSRFAIEIVALSARQELGESPLLIAHDALALLRRLDRSPSFIPVVSLPGLVFLRLAQACVDLGQVPPDIATAVQQARRRPRPIETSGRWRRPTWLVADALWEVSRGNHDRAQQLFSRAVAECHRHNLRGPLRVVLRYTLRAAPPGSELLAMATWEFAQLGEQERIGLPKISS